MADKWKGYIDMDPKRKGLADTMESERCKMRFRNVEVQSIIYPPLFWSVTFDLVNLMKPQTWRTKNHKQDSVIEEGKSHETPKDKEHKEPYIEV